MLKYEDLQKVKVDEFTSPNVITVGEWENVEKVLSLMDDSNVRHLPVRDTKNNIVGIVTESDLASLALKKDDGVVTAKDLMTPSPYAVLTGTYLVDAVFKMAELKIGSLLIESEEGEVLGIFTSFDAMNSLVEVLRGDILSM